MARPPSAWGGRRFAACLLLLAVAGCDDGDGIADAGGPGLRDAQVLDASIIRDGGAVGSDAGVPGPADAGSSMDRCAIGECDPRDLGSCEVGRCVIEVDGSRCVEGVEPAGDGEECFEVGDCAAGLACFQVGARGVCAPVCCPGEDACGGEATCGGAGLLVGGQQVGWGRCAPRRECVLLVVDGGCEAREACYLVEPSSRVTECRFAGTAGVGEGCELPEDCAPGLHCGALTGRCIRICRLAGEDCPEDERCVAQASSPEGTGFCMIAGR
jgi:hypothetical protein